MSFLADMILVPFEIPRDGLFVRIPTRNGANTFPSNSEYDGQYSKRFGATDPLSNGLHHPPRRNFPAGAPAEITLPRRPA